MLPSNEKLSREINTTMAPNGIHVLSRAYVSSGNADNHNHSGLSKGAVAAIIISTTLVSIVIIGILRYKIRSRKKAVEEAIQYRIGQGQIIDLTSLEGGSNSASARSAPYVWQRQADLPSHSGAYVAARQEPDA